MRYLLCRVGAWGDNVIVTALVSYLKEKGNEVYVLTSAETGAFVFMNNPKVDKVIPYVRNSVPMDKLSEFFKAAGKAYECDKVIDLCESIECELALHPRDPLYNLPKFDRITRCNKNYYDFTFEFAGFPDVKGRRGELFFDLGERQWAEELTRPYKKLYKVLWGLSGSGRNKAYPAAEFVQMDLLAKFPEMLLMTVGDDVCGVLETVKHPRVMHMSGKLTYRQSMALCRYVNLVVSPDTGLLHSAGCFTTPKIGILGHSTKENITKYFINDYSIESKSECAPCFRLIYNADIQCPVDRASGGCHCMTIGQPAQDVYRHIETVINKFYYEDRRSEADRDIIRPAGINAVRERCYSC